MAAHASLAFLDWPLEMQVWSGITLLMTAAIGFVAGSIHGRTATRRALRKARHRLNDLMVLVQNSLENAQQTCALLSRFPDLLLSIDQLEKLDRQQRRLLSTITDVVDQQRKRITPPPSAPPAPAPSESSSSEKPLEAFSVTWLRIPEDPETELPNTSTCESNLAAMLEAGRRSGALCGLLLIRIDRLKHLRTRFGGTGARQFIRRLARICTQSVRDDDLVCRYSDDTFAVLLPDVDPLVGCRLAENIRNAVRNHRFHLDDTGSEVLVTASFGYTHCPGGDDLQLVLGRARDALARSEQRGRNQLHIHDEDGPRLCATD